MQTMDYFKNKKTISCMVASKNKIPKKKFKQEDERLAHKLKLMKN